jgi:hypothetical protein
MKKKLNIAEVQKNLDEVIEQLKQNGGYVEVVEGHHTAAVILSIVDFAKLMPFLPKVSPPKKKPEKEWKLRGSMELVGDIEEASAEISKSILESIEKQEL